MALQSLSYLVCLTALWFIAWPVRTPRYRNRLLLLASYLFYATWGLGFLAVLVASSVVNWAWGRVLSRRLTPACLWTGVAFNIALLAVVKYLPPLGYGAAPSSPVLHRIGGIIMPVGVSFWTFQALSYLFDIYREEELDPSLTEFSLYMAFWPTVLSGPVCRLPEMLRQFRERSSASWEDVSVGTYRIVLGLFMKVVLAQLLATGRGHGEGVNYGFDEIVSGWGGTDVWALAIGFGFELFFDFAGYSHIAIGSARLFGLRLAENFDRPYLSTTPSIFWTRWHMSLSFWIRDYVFMPLATLRREVWWRYLALAMSMVLFGLWHAASVTFLLWGLYQGVLLVAHRQIQALRRKRKPSLPALVENFLSWTMTFSLVSLGWIFFRAQELHQALAMLAAVFRPASYLHPSLRPDFYVIMFLVVAGYFAYNALEVLFERATRTPAVARVAWVLSPLYYGFCLILIVIWSRQENLFVYFQF